MRIITILLGSALIFMSSCSSDYGNRIISEEANLTVLYSGTVESNIAVKFAQFWKEKELTGKTKQTIQLSNDSVYTIKLIAQFPDELIVGHKESLKGLSFDELELLTNLKKELDSIVFDNKNVRIQLCNDHFTPLMTIE